jgi:hypothetical protein
MDVTALAVAIRAILAVQTRLIGETGRKRVAQSAEAMVRGVRSLRRADRASGLSTF